MRKGQPEIIVEDGEIKGKIVADPDDSWIEKGRGECSPKSCEIAVRLHKQIIGSIDWNDVDIPCLTDEEPEADAV